jgi:hypothetical protein
MVIFLISSVSLPSGYGNLIAVKPEDPRPELIGIGDPQEELRRNAHTSTFEKRD